MAGAPRATPPTGTLVIGTTRTPTCCGTPSGPGRMIGMTRIPPRVVKLSILRSSVNWRYLYPAKKSREPHRLAPADRNTFHTAAPSTPHVWVEVETVAVPTPAKALVSTRLLSPVSVSMNGRAKSGMPTEVAPGSWVEKFWVFAL